MAKQTPWGGWASEQHILGEAKAAPADALSRILAGLGATSRGRTKKLYQYGLTRGARGAATKGVLGGLGAGGLLKGAGKLALKHPFMSFFVALMLYNMLKGGKGEGEAAPEQMTPAMQQLLQRQAMMQQGAPQEQVLDPQMMGLMQLMRRGR